MLKIYKCALVGHKTDIKIKRPFVFPTKTCSCSFHLLRIAVTLKRDRNNV